MTAILKTYISPEEYLERERAAECKSEYYDGEIFAMAGASNSHNLITANISAHILMFLRGKNCNIYSSDMKVHIPQSKGMFTYPDILIACEPKFLDSRQDVLLNPITIAEVLSDSTAEYDRTTKFELYAKIGSLQEYILVEQKRPFVQIYSRSQSGEWIYSAVSDLNGVLFLKSIDFKIRLSDVYDKVDFEELPIRAVFGKPF